MPFNLLLLPLLSGYLFTHLTYCTRFRAHFLTRLALNVDTLGPAIGVWKGFAPFPFSGSAVGSLGVAYAASLLVNQIQKKTKSSQAAINRHGDYLMKLLHGAQREKKTVMLTLSDRKVYVGYVVLDLNLKPEMPYVSILPTASGYREKDTLRVHLTVSYGDLYGEIAGGLRDDVAIEDFEVLVPTSMIVSARIFSLRVYREYFGDRPNPRDTERQDEPPSKRKTRGRAHKRSQVVE